jgi:hypothetical protein
MADKVRLTAAQVRWLNDPRPYFDEYRDRTARALIDKGIIEITERDLGGSKAGYKLTPAGRASRKGE